MGNRAIKVGGLGKRYRIGERQKYKTLRDVLTESLRAPARAAGRLLRAQRDGTRVHSQFWALKDVSFEVAHGEVLGIIGRNGAGKSTLLKILSRITEPTEGKVRLRGRVGSLLEVGTGFHPELTGRENVYLNGAILGMTRAEIEHKFDEIVDFAEVEKFIDTPVKHYSSGMGVRLGFAVAAHLEPEILLVDEVLAVGDAAFQKKCLGKMGSVASGGRTILFVSHNMATIQALCPRTVLLDHGAIAGLGPTPSVIGQYIAMTDNLVETSLADRVDRSGNGLFRFTSIRFADDEGQILNMVPTGRTLNVHLDYTCRREMELDSLRVSIGFRDRMGRFLFSCPSNVLPTPTGRLGRRGSLTCTIPRFPLPEGEYQFNLFAAIGNVVADWIQEAGLLRVEAGDFYGTGKLTPESRKGVLVDFDWRIA